MTNHKTLQIEFTKPNPKERMQEAIGQLNQYFGEKEQCGFIDIIYGLSRPILGIAIASENLMLNHKTQIIAKILTDAFSDLILECSNNPQKIQETFGLSEIILQTDSYVGMLKYIQNIYNQAFDQVISDALENNWEHLQSLKTLNRNKNV